MAAVLTFSAVSAAELRVTVVGALGQPISEATVCAGTPQNPRQYGSATTNSQGVATFRNLPAGNLHVIAHRLNSGERVVHAMGSGMQQITVRLPVEATGTTCGAVPTPGSAPISNSDQPEPPPRQFDPRLSDIQRQQSGASLQPIQPPQISLREEYCFGALGAQCGGAQFGLPIAALCAGGRCQINAGSWEHDECCFANPRGMACQVGPADYVLGHDGKCVNEWNKALARLQAGLNWIRQVDFLKPNRTGKVVFADYCAPAGSRVHQDDVRYCCSRQADRTSRLPAHERICR